MLNRVAVSLLALGLTAGEPQVFKKVDYFTTNGEKEKKHDARLVLDSDAGLLVIADEDNGREVFAEIPLAAVTELAYEKSKHRRWKSGLLLTPFALFSRGKKHWLTIAFDGVESLPQNYVYVRLDKNNFRQILSAVEAATGITASRTEEE